MFDWEGNESEELKKYSLSAKIYRLDADDLDSDKQAWLKNVANNLRAINSFISGSEELRIKVTDFLSK